MKFSVLFLRMRNVLHIHKKISRNKDTRFSKSTSTYFLMWNSTQHWTNWLDEKVEYRALVYCVYGAREISSLNYVEYAVQSVISICMGWRGRRSSRSRALWGGRLEGDRGLGRGGEGEGCCAGDRADQYLALPGWRRARPSASRTTSPYCPQPTTRLFNTCRIWDASFFMLNDRAA